MSYGTEIQDSWNLKSGHFRISRKNPTLWIWNRPIIKNLIFKNRARSIDSRKWASISKRDRALLKAVFVLHGQAFGYAQSIRGFWYLLRWSKNLWPDHTPTRSTEMIVAPAARVILSQTQAFRDGGYWWKRWRTGSRYHRCRCHDAVICVYSRDLARWYTQGPHSSSKQLSSKKCTPNDIPRRVGPREEIRWVGFTWVCLQLNCCCDSQRSYSHNRFFPSRPHFPVKYLVLGKYKTYRSRT